MKIGWVADFDLETHPGGAQKTNQYLIEWGKEQKNLDIKILNKDSINTSLLKQYDILIVNNITWIAKEKEEVLNHIIYNSEYLRFEHDYFFHPLGKDLFNNSIANIFLSPLHYKENKREIKFTNRNRFIQPSPIDTKMFYKDTKIKRRPNLVLWVGEARAHKGIENVLELARRQPTRQFVFATIPGQTGWQSRIKALKNCFLIGKIPYDHMNLYYNYAQYFIHLPNWVEPFGRTVAEAYLAGCDLIVGDNTGFLSYDWKLESDYEEIKEKVSVENAARHFWKNVFKFIK